MMNGSLYIKRSLTTLAKSLPLRDTQAIEEGAFDEWSAADISDAAAFALSHRDMDMSLDYDSDMDMFESPAERVLIVGLLLLACAILAGAMRLNLWHPLPILDIFPNSFTFSRIHTVLDKLFSLCLMVKGSLYIKHSLTALAKFLSLRGDF
ncbi:hypothetical protein C0989_001948 [Termitomyces sp. Mn162]|nr:hypothetical protein C0989_001948 [Termitomyces sp. Mn162]